MRSLSLILFILGFAFVPHTNAAESENRRPPCRPFRVHNGATPPYAWEKIPAESSITTQREEWLVKKISRLPTYGSFLDSYLPWKEEQKSQRVRVERLECIYFYAKHDTDGDGIPDWSAQIDRRPSAVLYPQDEDIDGDGVPNLLDPAPFNRAVKGKGGKIPLHLVSAEKELQAEIMEKYGILAIDHSDTHSPEVLRSLIFLLDQALPKNFTKTLKGFRYLYAFSGHDRETDIAAYHVVAKAISIGGLQAFPATGKLEPKPDILSALAHEIGHAVLLEKTTAPELADLAKKFGHWSAEETKDLYAASFFRPHPQHLLRRGERTREPATTGAARETNFVSSYATSNIHEWFAESFAAHLMVSLGEKNALGGAWQRSLVSMPKSRRYHWSNYNNISAGLRAWFAAKLAP